MCTRSGEKLVKGLLKVQSRWNVFSLEEHTMQMTVHLKTMSARHVIKRDS